MHQSFGFDCRKLPAFPNGFVDCRLLIARVPVFPIVRFSGAGLTLSNAVSSARGSLVLGEASRGSAVPSTLGRDHSVPL